MKYKPVDANELLSRVRESMNYNPHDNPLQRQNHVAEHRHFITMIERLASEDPFNVKLARAKKIQVLYEAPYEAKWAVVEYFAQKGKPLKVVQYHVYGEELIAGEELICWQWLPSTNFAVIEKGFRTEAEAIARMKMLREVKHA